MLLLTYYYLTIWSGLFLHDLTPKSRKKCQSSICLPVCKYIGPAYAHIALHSFSSNSIFIKKTCNRRIMNELNNNNNNNNACSFTFLHVCLYAAVE